MGRVTHVRRHHEHYHRRGTGHLYQGRFKGFPVAEDEYFLTLCRYVEANAVRANWWRVPSNGAHRSKDFVLSRWPVNRPRNWTTLVDGGLSEEELQDVRDAWDGAAPWDQRPGCWRPPPG